MRILFSLKHRLIWSHAAAALLAAACAPANTAQPSTAGSAPAASVQVASATPPASAAAGWDSLVSAAQKEGKLALIGPPGDVYREIFNAFQQKFGIPIELRVGNGPPDLYPLVTTERQAGQYLWDVATHNPGNIWLGFKPLGAVDPLRPALILPEVVDDSKWQGGFAAGWADKDKTLDYFFVSYQEASVYVNRALIPESQLSQLDQLWDPKWKGKIAMQDPRFPGGGSVSVATWLAVKGDDKLRSFFRDQQPVLTQERRQLFEWSLRGQYPISVGLSGDVFKDFVDQGVDVSQVKPLMSDDPAAFRLSHASGAVGLFNRAPHPSAANLFVNWLLSQEGQAIYSQKTGYNSRRTDVPVANQEQAVDPKRRYIDLATEEGYPVQGQAVAIAKE